MGLHFDFGVLGAGTIPLRKPIGERILDPNASSPNAGLLASLIGRTVVIDLKSPYVCLGTLKSLDESFLELADADLHDFRDGTATREVYVYDAARVGIRRNRTRVLIRRDEVVAVSVLSDVAES
jgi:small nuclear ribonucleoprotein (snRNP)-like protein